MFYGLSLAPKKYYLTIDKHGTIQEHKLYRGFNDSKKLLDCSHYFIMIEGKKNPRCSLKAEQNRLIAG